MKKILLLAAAASMAASAMAADVFPKASEMDGVDLTPAGYAFTTYDKEFVGYTATDVLPWNMNVNWYRDNYVAKDQTIGDGLIVVTGGQVYNKAENIAVLSEATKIIDMGGTVGKVYCLNFSGSNFPAKYKELTGADLQIGEAIAGAQPLLFWHFDHTKLEKYLGQKKNDADWMPLRVRMEVNIYANKQSSKGNYWKAYVNDDQNNVRPADKEDNAAGDILVDPAEFAYRWCEKDPTSPTDAAIWDEGPNKGAGEWNPNRWLVYEWDINVAAPETEEELFKGNIRIKNEIPGGANHDSFTVLIRGIYLYAPANESREYIYAKRPRTWNTYEVGPATGAGVKDVEAADFQFSVNGGTATFSAPAQVYNLSGALVAEGTAANLSKGLYIAKSGSKTVKLVVK